jgi:hypothetical protein
MLGLRTAGSGSNTHLHFCYRQSNTFTFAFWGNDLNTQPYPDDFLTWVHWAGTFNATTKARTLYRNGVRVAFDVSPVLFKGTGPITVGGNSVLASSTQIDDVRIYAGVELRPGEVAKAMAGSATGETLRYTFDADSLNSSTAADSSGSGNDGILAGPAEIHALCPAGTTESPGGLCTPPPCQPGTTGPDGGRCAACAAGKYKGRYGPSACLPCAAGTYSASARWIVCAGESGQCSCPDGALAARFGAAAGWAVATPVPDPGGPFLCGIPTFGRDPLFGTLKTCQVPHPTVPPRDPPSSPS